MKSEQLQVLLPAASFAILMFAATQQSGIALRTQSLPETRPVQPPSREVEQLQKVANQGNAMASYYLFNMYESGSGVPNRDHAEAFLWLQKAADQGYHIAQGNLGGIYLEGKGVAQDYAEAAKWYRKASDQGDSGAQICLGKMFASGEGVMQNDVEAYKWLSLSAIVSGGDSYALKLRDEVAARMTPQQISEAQSLVREWKPLKPQ